MVVKKKTKKKPDSIVFFKKSLTSPWAISFPASEGLFWIVMVRMYTHTVCMYLYVWGGWVHLSSVCIACTGSALSSCAICPCFDVTGEKKKSGIISSCSVMINDVMASVFPKAWTTNQCNVLELILLPTHPSWLGSWFPQSPFIATGKS